MDKHKFWRMTLRGLFLLSAFVPNVVSAKYPYIPFTPLEQVSTLSSVANHNVSKRLFPSKVKRILIGLPHQSDYESDYNRASTEERRKISQGKGERGAARYAGDQRWKTLLSPHGRILGIGPDSAYWDSHSGKVRVIEAKGGSGRTGVFYGVRQGTNRNTIRSAKIVVTSLKASRNEKLQAARIIKAAQKGHLTTGVVATRHQSGSFLDPKLNGRWATRNVAREATQIGQWLARQHPGSRKVLRMANFLHNVDRLKYQSARRLSDLGSATARSIGLSATQQAGLRRIGLAGARWLPPLAVGVAGVAMVTAYYQFGSGLTSPREFYRSSAGPTILVVFTATGALVGSVGFGVGAVAGGSIGAMASLPVEVAVDWAIERYYHDFDTRQRQLVDAAVEEFYGVDATLVEEL